MTQTNTAVEEIKHEKIFSLMSMIFGQKISIEDATKKVEVLLSKLEARIREEERKRMVVEIKPRVDQLKERTLSGYFGTMHRAELLTIIDHIEKALTLKKEGQE